MHRKNTNKRRGVVGGLIAALVILGATAGPALASVINGHTIQDGTVRSRELANGEQGVKSADVTDDSLHAQDFDASTQNKLSLVPLHGQRLNALEQRLSGQYESGPTTVTDVGGTFGKYTETVRATLLNQITLQPGLYLISADGFFITNSADANRDVRMQLAVRYDNGTDWGQDLGTGFTGKLSPLANREGTTSTTRLVNVPTERTIEVRAFGYEDDQGSGASGQVVARSVVTVVQVDEAIG